MANTKHAATLLSHANEIPTQATGLTQYRLPTTEEALEVATEANGLCSVVSYTVEYDRNSEPVNVIYILDTQDGRRAIANAKDPINEARVVLSSDPIDKQGDLIWDEEQKKQFFTLRH